MHTARIHISGDTSREPPKPQAAITKNQWTDQIVSALSQRSLNKSKARCHWPVAVPRMNGAAVATSALQPGSDSRQVEQKNG